MSQARATRGRIVVDSSEPAGRYDRQELITWWDQDRLARAQVLVVGAGALGNEIVKNLALLGVGRIVVVDMDVVEHSNLSRCVLFCDADEGQYKADVVAEAAMRLNPGIEAIAVSGDVRLAAGLGIFAEMDLVIGGLDSREARLHVNQACWKTSVPWVDGSIEGLMGVMRVFVPPHSACYECTMGARDHEIVAARRACSLLTRDQMIAGKVPTTATSASIIAGMQVQEAVKLLHRDRLDYEFGGRGFAFNGLTHDSYPVTYGRHDACLAHDTYDLACALESSAQATFGELLALADDELDDPVLTLELDIVREFRCRRCDQREPLFRPLLGLSARDAACPSCAAERTFGTFHSVSRRDADLLNRTPAGIGLPPADIVTVHDRSRRMHVRLGDARSWLGAQAAAQTGRRTEAPSISVPGREKR